MKRSLSPLLSLLAACAVPHMVGENQNNQGAITCATTTCNGTAVCVDSVCVQPTGSFCGGFGGLQCPGGQRCVDDPRDGCDWGTDADCGGVCVASTPPPDAGTTTDGGTNGPMHCGGLVINPQTCPSGYRCVDDPNSCSMAVDCEGICEPDPNALIQCGGHVINPVTCPTGMICVDNPNGPSMAVDAQGICIKRIQCAGFAGLQCPSGMDCLDDPNDSCDPNNGGADCLGYCNLHKGSTSCGGIAGFPCPSSLRCVDDPADSCDPLNGGADCGGICVP